MKPEGNIKLIRVQSENGEPVKKEATFDDIIMLVFFLNQDPKCKDSRYKVGQRLFVGTDSPIIDPNFGCLLVNIMVQS